MVQGEQLRGTYEAARSCSSWNTPPTVAPVQPHHTGRCHHAAEYLADVVPQGTFLTERPDEHRRRLADAEEGQRAQIGNLDAMATKDSHQDYCCGSLSETSESQPPTLTLTLDLGEIPKLT